MYIYVYVYHIYISIYIYIFPIVIRSSGFLKKQYGITYFVFWIANPLRLTACDLDNMIGMQKYLNYLPKVEFPIQITIYMTE